jgi:hypothetical protein
MAKGFKKLRGQRVYITLPPREESKLIVDENTKEALNKELLVKMSKLQVFAVGDLVSDIQEGDWVLVDPSALSKGLLVPISDKQTVLMLSSFDVIHIW